LERAVAARNALFSGALVRLAGIVVSKEYKMDDVTGTACLVLGLAFVFSGLVFLLPAPKPRMPKYKVGERFEDGEVIH
jgi:hypothetical protein